RLEPPPAPARQPRRAARARMRPRVIHLLGTAAWEGAGVARIVAALASALSQYETEAWFLQHDVPPATPLPLGEGRVRASQGHPNAALVSHHDPLAEVLARAGARVRFVPFRGLAAPLGAARFA